MNVTKIEFTSFRNIESEIIEFNDGINVIYGENAQGKTNILEGIYLFARGKSFRAFKDKELVNFESSVAYAVLDFNTRDEKTRLGVEISKSLPKKFYRNNVKINKTSEIIGEFRAVLFCPSHLGIIKDAPAVRRKFIDVAISQLRPVYLKMMTRYNQVLEERNTIIKMAPQEREANESLLDVYSEELASLCCDIADIRNEYIKKLDYWVKIFFNEMTSGKEIPKITYESNGDDGDFESREALKQRYLHLLTDYKEREYKYGATLFGIHKDDLKIEINGRDSRLYSSQGQQRSLALAMKMAEGEISREGKGEYPVFLFDDVLSELDDTRKKYILSNIKGKQVIITACDKSVFENNEGCHFINIKNGKKGEILSDFSVDNCDKCENGEMSEKTPETEL
jgi:DNA replication and repair protein RecF